MKTHDPLAVANWFLARAEDEGKTLDPMKLQKLIYFAHGWALALTGVPLLKERPQAWEYGPVIPSVYHEFKSFGRKAIRGRATTWEAENPDAADFLDMVFNRVERKMEDDADAEALLRRIWEVYGGLSSIQLSNMTHEHGGAWQRAYQLASGSRGADISDELVKEEFVGKIGRGANADATPAA